MPAAKTKKGRKIGRNARSQAQARYKAACGGLGRCFGRKVQNLMRHNGMTRLDADRFMQEVYRKRKTGADR